MSIRRNIFLSIFATACLLVLAASYIGYRTASGHLERQYMQRYDSLSGVIAHTFQQLEKNADHISLSAIEFLRAHVQKEGLPENDVLARMADRLKVSRLYIIGKDGKFIRDSKGSDQLPQGSLFDYCEGYRNLVTGGSDLEMTPIVPSIPYTGAFKFTMAPDNERNVIIEVGMRLDFIGEVLKSVLDSDKNILSLSLMSPNGQVLGQMSAENIEFAPTDKFILPSEFGGRIDKLTQKGIFTRKITLNIDTCCECQVKGVANSEGAYFYVLQTNVSMKPLTDEIKSLTVTTLAVCGLALLISLLLARWLAGQLIARLERISNTVGTIIKSGDLSLRLNETGEDEAAVLAKNFDKMIDTIQTQQSKIISNERDRVLANVASQVAHDVRSPLTALETVLANTKGIEEEKRVMIRTATKRIKDIANNLLEVYKTDIPIFRRRSFEKKPYHVGMLVESIVSEKRVRYSDHEKLAIESEIAEDALDLFLDADENDLKRVLSNLIDNAVESLRARQGTVVVQLIHINGIAILKVNDNGIGIHPDKIKKIMEGGVTFGKDKGHGIGLAYVREKCNQWGAEFHLESTVSRGTTSKIRIRSVPPPPWFTSVINIRDGFSVLIADDDPSIHQVWSTRLSGKREPISVYSIDAFEAKVKELRANETPFICLVDYEFIGESRTGIDAIKTLGVSWSSVLVTSRHDEEQVTERCTDLRIKMIPKGIAPVIPIKFISNEITYVFLDDDPFIIEAWEIEARTKNIRLTTFNDIKALLDAAKTMEHDTLFYLDHNLGGEYSGIDVAKKLHQMGFREIFLSTGYDPDLFKDEKVIKGVFGKEPPF